jgi:hypothetical protein
MSNEESDPDSNPRVMRYGDYLRRATVNYGEVRYGDVVRISPRAQAARIGVTPRHVMRIIAPYLSVRIGEQARAVLPLALYLAVFQIVILRQTVEDSVIIATGLACVIMGLVLFMEGLKVGLMPFAERIGSELPVKLKLRGIFATAFVLGVAATVAEPAIGVLQTAGASVSIQDAPLLYLMLSRYSAWLVLAVAIGVGGATVLGILRTVRGWSLKPLIFALLLPTLGLTAYSMWEPTGQLARLVGLAWDCGGVTTGPVTVPLVLALGIGVANASSRDNGFSGFGVVTLASILPILTVLLLGVVLLNGGGLDVEVPVSTAASVSSSSQIGILPALQSVASAFRAVVPLCFILFAILSWVLREKLANRQMTLYGMGLCLIGMAAFNIGLTYGLGALGSQVGTVMPAAFQAHEAVEHSPLYHSAMGRGIAILFAFFLGFGATLAEPALRALALTVENVTNGAMERGAVIRAVSFGVGSGIAMGVSKIIWDFSVTPILLVGYGALLLLTLLSSEKYVNVAWDSAGVTTGPVTVPLVIALGLGLGQASGVVEGFGILAMASLFPIGSVLVLGLIAEWRMRRERRHMQSPQADVLSEVLISQ